MTTDVADLLARARDGDRRATGRLLTIAERGGPDAERLRAATDRAWDPAHVVGITGAPGAGKSTLVGALLAVVDAPQRCAVVAVDPSSPVSGGALLGDRLRLDPSTAAFVRSFASRGHGGGLALGVPLAVRVLDAVGYQVVFVETVGVGQVETEIAALADTTVVVVTPGWGDAVQVAKAGLLELADVYVVNQADRPDAEATRRELEAMLDLGAVTGSGRALRPPVLATVARDGTGVSELWEAIRSHRDALVAHGLLDARRRARVRTEIASHLGRQMAEAVDRALASAAGGVVVAAAARGEVTIADAAIAVRGLVDTDGAARRA